jgi:hypothetical protein
MANSFHRDIISPPPVSTNPGPSQGVIEFVNQLAKPSILNNVRDDRPWHVRLWDCFCGVLDGVCNLVCAIGDLLQRVLNGLAAVVNVVEGALRVAIPLGGARLMYALTGSCIAAAVVAAIAYKVLG